MGEREGLRPHYARSIALPIGYGSILSLQGEDGEGGGGGLLAHLDTVTHFRPTRGDHQKIICTYFYNSHFVLEGNSRKQMKMPVIWKRLSSNTRNLIF